MSRVYVSLALVLVCTLGQLSARAVDKSSANESSPDPALEKILKAWEQASRQRKSVTGKFQKFSYDKTFAVETRATGSFVADIDRTADYQVQPVTLAKDAVSPRRDVKGRPYKLMSEEPDHWQWKKTCLQMTRKDGSTEKINFPDEKSKAPVLNYWYTTVFRDFYLSPYLLGMSEQRLKERFYVTLEKETEDQVRLKLLPRHERDECNFSEVQLILNKKDYTLAAIRMIDPPETKETVHMFEEIQVTARKDHPEFELCLQP